MSYIKPFIDRYGLHLPDYVDIRDYLSGEFLRIFGSDLYLGDDSQDYQMISVFSDMVDDVHSLIARTYNSFNPDYAEGRTLDLLLPLNGMRRISASHSRVMLMLWGDSSAVIGAGSVAVDKRGNRWIIQSEVILDGQGEGEVLAIAEQSGEIRAAAGDVHAIGTPTSGWVGVENLDDAQAGRKKENDAEVRERRAESVGVQSLAVMAALRGALKGINGVKRINVRENYDGAPDEHGIAGHTIAAVVEGGDDQEIAKMILDKKTPGCGLHGEVYVLIEDQSQNEVGVRFGRPDEVRVYVEVVLMPLMGYTEASKARIKNTVAEHIEALGIGETLQVGLLYGVVIMANEEGRNEFAPVSVKARLMSGTLSGDPIDINFNQVFVCDPTDVVVTTV